VFEIVKWQTAQVERLRAIVDKLPKTADGVPVVPMMEVWFWNDADYIDSAHAYTFSQQRHKVPISILTEWGWVRVAHCYSTREAVEAAGGEA
jgi:hypothetical protein